MPYVLPKDVTSPRKTLQLVQVLHKGEAGGEAYAMGFWGDHRKKHRVMLFRWNGEDDAPLGNPQSRGLSTWVVLGERTWPSVIDSLDPEMQAFARAFFDLEEK